MRLSTSKLTIINGGDIMKKFVILLILILLSSCQIQPKTGVVIDKDLVYIDNVGPIMHDLGDIPIGSVVQMRYDGVYMDSFPMQIEPGAKFTITDTDEHIVTTIVKILVKLKEIKPNLFSTNNSIGLTVNDLEASYENLILVILPRYFDETNIQFDNPYLDTLISINFEDNNKHGQQQVKFSLQLKQGNNQYIVDQGMLIEDQGLYQVEFVSSIDEIE